MTGEVHDQVTAPAGGDERKKLYAQCRDDLFKRQLSNSENLDRSILSLSTAGLGFSLAFIKDVVPFAHAEYLFTLYGSWLLFAAAIVSTLVSFVTSQRGVDIQLRYAEEYYLNGKDDFLKKPNWGAGATAFLNLFSCILFICAIVSSIAFVYLNSYGGSIMESKKTEQFVRAQQGMPIPRMQQTTTGDYEKRGAPIPSMQPIRPAQQPSQSSGGQDSGGNQASSGTGDAPKK